jgi:branched-subunit amino acid ABC-type transport system permease component
VGGQWSRVVIFSVLILVLVFRPSGILGSAQSVEKV